MLPRQDLIYKEEKQQIIVAAAAVDIMVAVAVQEYLVLQHIAAAEVLLIQRMPTLH